MQELTQADFEKYGLEKAINVSWLNNKNVRLYYIILIKTMHARV